MIPERTLVKRAQRGDARAFANLIYTYEADMYRLAHSYTRNDSDALDAVQESLVACWQKLPQLHNAASFRTWLLKITVNKSKDLVRLRIRRREEAELSDVRKSDERSADNSLFLLEFEDALDKLAEIYREPAALHYTAGLQAVEIAAMLNISPQAARKRLSRANEQLRAYFEEKS